MTKNSSQHHLLNLTILSTK